MKKKIIWFLFFVIGIFIPCFTYIYDNMENSVKTNSYNLGLTQEITKGFTVSQKIYIPKKIQKFGLMFATYLRENHGKIKVSIIQNNNRIEKIIEMSTLKNDEITNLELDISKLKKGEAILIVEGIDGKEGNSVSLYNSSDISLGKINDTEDKGLVLELNYFQMTKVVKFQLIFLLLSTSLFFYIYKLSDNLIKNNKKLFWVTASMIFCMINVKTPVVSFATEPYAEVLSNFLINGLNKNAFQNLIIPDVGYWPLFQRIIGLVIIKLFGFNLKITVFLLQNIGVFIICMFGSLFVLKEYRKYGTLLFRICISIILGGGVTLTSSVEGYYFFNFVYYGLVCLVFISLLNFSNFSKCKYVIIMLFCFLLVISKATFIALLPIVLGILIIFWKKITNREKIFLGIIIISNLFHIIFIKLNGKGTYGGESFTIPALNNVLYRMTQQFIFLFIPDITNIYNVGFLNITFLILWIGIILVNVYFYVKLKNKESVISLALIFVILGTIILNILTTGKYFFWNQEYEWLKTFSIINTRHSLFIILSYINIFVLMCYNGMLLFRKKYKINKNLLYILLTFLLVIRFSAFDNNKIKNQFPNSVKVGETLSDWNRYYSFLKRSNYMIPFEPFIILVKNNKIYNFLENEIVEPTPIQSLSTDTKLFGFEYNATGQVHEVNLEKELDIEYIYAQRLRTNNYNKIRVVGYNEKNEEVFSLKQLNKTERLFVGFKNEKPVNVKKLKFYNEDGTEAYVKNNLYFGVIN